MQQVKNTLYTLNKNGSYQQWKVFVDDNTVIVEFGREDGKLQTKTTTCTPKNVGRANETTGEQQAILEAESKYEKQVRLGYRVNKENLVLTPSKSPMLAADATKKAHMIQYPCHISKKLDGLRVLVTFDDNGEPVFNSRGNKTYPVQGLLVKQVKELRRLTGFDEFDGEIYIHGLPLQKIVSLTKKWRDIKSKEFGGYSSNDLEYYIFDIPSSLPFYSEESQNDGWEDPISRETALAQIDHIITDSLYELNEYGDIPLSLIKVVLGEVVESEDDVKESIGYFMQQGYEGTIIRNFKGKYEYGQRSNDLLKWKLFKEDEALIIDIEEDKNGEGVLVCKDRDGVVVKMKIKGTHQERLYENQLKNVGKWINFTYQAKTEDNNYQFPVGQYLREVDNNGKVLE